MSPKAARQLAWQREFDLVDEQAACRLHGRDRGRRAVLHRRGVMVSLTRGPEATRGDLLDALPAMPMTRHAEHRLKNRGITMQQVLTVTTFGRPERVHGATRYALDKSARQLLEQAMPADQLRSLRKLDIVAVVSDTGALITASHRTERLRRELNH